MNVTESYQSSIVLNESANDTIEVISLSETDDEEKQLKPVEVNIDKSKQPQFLLKVYFLYWISLLLTAIEIALNVYVPSLIPFNQQYYPVAIGILVTSIVVLSSLRFGIEVYPINLIVFIFFTLLFGWSLAMFCSMYFASEVIIVTIVVLITSLFLMVCFGLERGDNRNWKLMILFSGSVQFILFFVVTFVFLFCTEDPMFSFWKHYLIGFASMLYELYIIYVTSTIINNYKGDQTDHIIPSAIILYSDIIFCFLLAMRKVLNMCNYRDKTS
jgi:FtsH-binding integral membrane protein